MAIIETSDSNVAGTSGEQKHLQQAIQRERELSQPAFALLQRRFASALRP